MVNNMDEVTIYTDGACSGNPGPGGWGAILMLGENRKEIEFSNDLAKGCYILSFRTNTTIVSIKFVKI